MSTAGGAASAADTTVFGAADPAMDRREPDAATPRRRVSWANLLCRVLSVDALACPRCSTRERRVPMTVLAFLTDPDVVGRILRHLGLPTTAPALASAGRSPQPELGFVLAGEDAEPGRRDAEGDGEEGSGPRAPPSGLFR